MAIVKARWAGKEHGAMIARKAYSEISRPIPREILIEIGVPHEPQPDRSGCGTDLIWPVLRIVEPAGIEILSGNPHVCRHEIEAGD